MEETPMTISSETRREIIRADLLQKFENEDWHGVMDCAADLREHDAFQRGLQRGLQAASDLNVVIVDEVLEPWPPGPWKLAP